jgi:hypothetical protein
LIARAFDIKHSAVRRAALRGYEDPSGPGRRRALDPDSERGFIAWITQKAADNTATTKTELLPESVARLGTSITRGWVDSFLTRHADELWETKSLRQENSQLEVPRVLLDPAVEGFQHHVYGSSPELVFNLDEVGISEWEDRHQRKVIVPSAMRGRTIFHGIHGQ